MGAGLSGVIFDNLEWPLTRVSRSLCTYLQVEYLKKRCVLGTKLLNNTNRKPYTIYRMITLSMTLSDLWPRFQGHFIFSTLKISETTRDRARVTIECQQEVICALSLGDISNNLDGPLTRFLLRDTDMHIASLLRQRGWLAGWRGGWVAGWVSVTRRYCIKTAKPIWKPIILVSCDPCANSKGNPFVGGV